MVVANSLLRVFLTISTTPWRKERFNYHRTFACFVFIIYALKRSNIQTASLTAAYLLFYIQFFKLYSVIEETELFSKRDNRCLKRNYEETA